MTSSKSLIVRVPKKKKIKVPKRPKLHIVKNVSVKKSSKPKEPVKKYKINLRSVDDKLIEAIQELDASLDKMLSILVQFQPRYVADHLLNQTYTKDIGPGGVKVFSGSRKKEKIKLKLLELVSHIDSPKDFIETANEQGLVRNVKERIITNFVDNFNGGWILLLKHYGDPFAVYMNLYPHYLAFNQLKNNIVQVTFTTLSRIVLSRYKGWTFQRVIASLVDYSNYEEDVQNSLFSIARALGLFDIRKNKSFFSYATRWIKEGITSSDFILDKEQKTEDPLGNVIPASFKVFEESDVDFIDGQNYKDYVDGLYRTPENDSISALDYFKGSFPVPNEIRILYRLMKLKNVNTE